MTFSKVHLTVVRRLTQTIFGTYCLYSGWQFYQFRQWALHNTATFAPRPPSVEAFLPISAMMSLKKLLLTGHFDRVHPAGLTVLMALITIALLFRKGGCGWICPVGFISNIIEKVGGAFKMTKRPPFLVDLFLRAPKYFLLFFFVYLIFFKMDLAAIESFLRSPYNITADGRMLDFFLKPGNLSAAIITFLVCISLFVKNFWCRYLCPYGALLGLVAYLSPFSITRAPELCISCSKCDRICPSQIQISSLGKVHDPECIGCLDCVSTCPQAECLTVKLGGFFRIPPIAFPLLVVLTFLLFWTWAITTGHWQTSIPVEVMQRYSLQF